MGSKRAFYLLFMLLALSLTVYGCGGDGGGGGGGEVGTNSITINGGDGSAGNGGGGGDIYIESYDDVKILKTGSVDTSFSLPTGQPSYSAGTNELNITADTTINTVTLGDAVTAGSYFLINGYNYIYQDDGDGVAETDDIEVNSLKVASGVALTLGLNEDWNNLDGDGFDTTGQDLAYVRIYGDVEISGTLQPADLFTGITTPDSTNVLDSGALRLYAANIFIRSTGSVLARGGDSATGQGGDGGEIDLEASLDPSWGGFFIHEGSSTIDNSGGNSGTGFNGGAAAAAPDYNWYGGGIYIYADGTTINTGTINSNGGDGDNGGNASWIELDADGHLYNTGDLTANGGTGSSGDGGAGIWIGLYCYTGSAYNSGDLTTNGGNGTLGGGNAEYGVDIYAEIGRLVNSGNLTASGGSATSSGNGGDAGYFWIGSGGGPMLNSGDMTATGGAALGAGNSAGDGGYLYIGQWDTWWYNELAPAGIKWAGDINLSGGSGDNGGYGGYMDVYMDYESDVLPPTAPIEFYGYGANTISLDGGNSTGGDGGNGGYFEIYTSAAYTGGADYPAGSIINESHISATGGNGATSGGFYGGNGGSIDFEAPGYGDGNEEWDSSGRDGGSIGVEAVYSDFTVGTTKVENSGNIDISGGSGDYGGYSGWIYFYAHDGLKNTGDITANGGAGTTQGGDSDWVEFGSDADIENSGTIRATGGTGVTGGDSDYVGMYAADQTTNSGSIYADGGAGTTTGGDGGYIDLYSAEELTKNTAGLLTVAGGVGGTTDGVNGYILIDWVNVTPADGTMP